MRKIGGIMLIIFAGACKQINGNSTGVYQDMAVSTKASETVSVSIYSSIGVKSPKKIRCQLIKEARKLYPQCKGVTNIRYDKYTAYAEVIP